MTKYYSHDKIEHKFMFLYVNFFAYLPLHYMNKIYLFYFCITCNGRGMVINDLHFLYLTHTHYIPT